MKHEEAIKILRETHDNALFSVRTALETICPELAESEDERIRKWLVNYFSTIKEMIWIHRDITCEQILDWLEKQKECVSNNFDDVWDEEDCEEIIAEGQKLTPRFKELLKEVCHAWYDRGAKLEKQKEQKPAWSEEDRLHYVNVLEALEYVKGCKSDYDKIEAVKSDIAWLKLLRNRVGKDSLQPHWKPTKEQMEALKEALETYNGFEEYDAMKSLYNDLKKL